MTPDQHRKQNDLVRASLLVQPVTYGDKSRRVSASKTPQKLESAIDRLMWDPSLRIIKR